MKINGNEIPKEVMAKALTCDTPEDLVKLAKDNGLELTTEQAKAFLDEMGEVDLTSDQLQKVAGGEEAWAGVEVETCLPVTSHAGRK